nr:hypothetical protein [Chlamydiota bacterium]
EFHVIGKLFNQNPHIKKLTFPFDPAGYKEKELFNIMLNYREKFETSVEYFSKPSRISFLFGEGWGFPRNRRRKGLKSF